LTLTLTATRRSTYFAGTASVKTKLSFRNHIARVLVDDNVIGSVQVHVHVDVKVNGRIT
jgi:hypothetical protein